MDGIATDMKARDQQLYDWGQKSREFKEQRIELKADMAQVALVPQGLDVVDLQDFIPEDPLRAVTDHHFVTGESFTKYMNEHKTEASRVFGQTVKAPYYFRGIVDYHEAHGKAGWCQHVITWDLSYSQQFKTWYGINDKFLDQQAFVEFLKDNRLDIVSPDNGSILSLCMELEAHADSRCNAKVPTNRGQTLSFVEEVTTSVGGEKVDVPDSIVLKMPMFEGSAAMEFQCDFKFRLNSGRMTFGVRMIGIESALRAALLQSKEMIEDVTGLPVYL